MKTSLLCACIAPQLAFGNLCLDRTQSLEVVAPKKPLTEESLQIVKPGATYADWTAEDHAQSYDLFQKMACKLNAETFLIKGETEPEFKWEFVPFQKTASTVTRFWNQFRVLWSVSFGGAVATPANQASLKDRFTAPEDYSPQSEKIDKACAFCRPACIESQEVLEGERVRVLYNYAPIGFGGERLHFLIIPKIHRQDFRDLTKEEYVEAAELSQKLIAELSKTRAIQKTFLFHKTGVDAGQVVPHWHMHVVLTASGTQEAWGKLTILKNMLVPPKPLPPEALSKKVQELKKCF